MGKPRGTWSSPSLFIDRLSVLIWAFGRQAKGFYFLYLISIKCPCVFGLFSTFRRQKYKRLPYQFSLI